jgi:hypothetical protein
LSQNELVTLTNSMYPKPYIVQAEANVFSLLGFHLLSATPLDIMEHLLALSRLDRPLSDALLRRARLLLNASLTDYGLLSCSAPCLAVSALLSAYTAHSVSCQDLLELIAAVPLGVDPQSHGVDVCRAAQHAAVDNMAAAGTTLETNSRVGAPLELSPSPTKITELRLEGGGQDEQRAGTRALEQQLSMLHDNPQSSAGETEKFRDWQRAVAEVEQALAAKRTATPHASPGGDAVSSAVSAVSAVSAAVTRPHCGATGAVGPAAGAAAPLPAPVPIGSKRASAADADEGAGPPMKQPRGHPSGDPHPHPHPQ